jgi:hypothetical protein
MPRRSSKPKPRLTHDFPRHPDEWYVEERWCAERFLAIVRLEGALLDPSCGMGTIVHAARRAGLSARGSDLRPRWRTAPGYVPSFERLFAQADVLNGHWPPRRGIWTRPQIVMGNPPFRRVLPFYEAAMARAEERVVFLLPMTWLCGAQTSAWLETTPLACVYPLGPRPSMPPGEYLLAGKKPEGGRKDFAWYEWRKGFRPRVRGGRPEIYPIRRDPPGVQNAGAPA